MIKFCFYVAGASLLLAINPWFAAGIGGGLWIGMRFG